MTVLKAVSVNIFVLCVLACLQDVYAQDTPQKAAIAGGLCIYIAADADASDEILTLAGKGQMLLHVLADGEKSSQVLREKVLKKNLQGKVQIEFLSAKGLPHVDALANMVVIHDAKVAKKMGIKEGDALRVLASGGTLFIKNKK
ncbi:MAG: hypothetical protein HRU15_07115, partial [Planctomycetes bacterium]|nr:hypothetical protein [Planctomycetota bacterium]